MLYFEAYIITQYRYIPAERFLTYPAHFSINAFRISPDIKDAAFCTGIRVSNSTDTWKGVFNVYVTTKSASEKNSAQTALTCAQDPLILYKYVHVLQSTCPADTVCIWRLSFLISTIFLSSYLTFIFDSTDGGPVRLQDFKDICDAMSLTPQGIEALTNFLMNNIEQILRTVPTGESIVTHMYRLLASKVALDDEILKVRLNIRCSTIIAFRVQRVHIY